MNHLKPYVTVRTVHDKNNNKPLSQTQWNLAIGKLQVKSERNRRLEYQDLAGKYLGLSRRAKTY